MRWESCLWLPRRNSFVYWSRENISAWVVRRFAKPMSVSSLPQMWTCGSAVSEGKFREDLFYRLNTIPIQMPPLRDRGEDILLLFRLFAMQMAEKYRLPKITLADDAKQIMLHYKWPGNVRQLKNITEQMSILSEQREITAEMLTQFIPRDPESTQLAIVPGRKTQLWEWKRFALQDTLWASWQCERLAARPEHGEEAVWGDPCARQSTCFRFALWRIDRQFASIGKAYYTSICASQPDWICWSRGNFRAGNTESKRYRQTTGGEALWNETMGIEKAAQELGISDRTLYRRIKQYGLDNTKPVG